MQIDLFSLLTFIVVVAMFFSLGDRLKRIEAKVGWLEHRLEHGLAALEVEPEQDPTSRAVDDLVSQGKRGEAIRLHQLSTGVSFETARDHVDLA